jgi:hypothetical protein
LQTNIFNTYSNNVSNTFATVFNNVNNNSITINSILTTIPSYLQTSSFNNTISNYVKIDDFYNTVSSYLLPSDLIPQFSGINSTLSSILNTNINQDTEINNINTIPSYCKQIYFIIILNNVSSTFLSIFRI